MTVLRNSDLGVVTLELIYGDVQACKLIYFFNFAGLNILTKLRLLNSATCQSQLITLLILCIYDGLIHMRIETYNLTRGGMKRFTNI